MGKTPYILFFLCKKKTTSINNETYSRRYRSRREVASFSSTQTNEKIICQIGSWLYTLL